MSSEDLVNPQFDERFSRRVKLLNEAAAGRLEELQCPECDKLTVSVWFTHPEKESYRMWFLCSACNFHTRVQCTGKPSHFSEIRRRIDLEERDASILGESIFKRPASLIE
jgi:hypothetical protein